MPTYDYECTACDHRFEFFQKITEDPLAVCPQCKKKKLVRLFGTGAAVVFKGSGFYQTDYRSENYRKAADQEKKGSESKGNSDSPAAETKSNEKSLPSEKSSDSPAPNPGRRKKKR